jgi:hypothetical protein
MDVAADVAIRVVEDVVVDVDTTTTIMDSNNSMGNSRDNNTDSSRCNNSLAISFSSEHPTIRNTSAIGITAGPTDTMSPTGT